MRIPATRCTGVRWAALLLPGAALLLAACSTLPASSTPAGGGGTPATSGATSTPSSPSGSPPASVTASGASAGSTGAGTPACRSLTATPQIKEQVTAAHRAVSGLRYIEPVAGDFFYGGCGATSYAATDFEFAIGAGYAEEVGLQDDGSAMQYYRRVGAGPWRHVAADSFPRDPHGCRAVAALPRPLATLWAGCPEHPSVVMSRTYLAASGWSARNPVYRPGSVVLSGDSTLGLKAMRWTTWGQERAQGTGLGWSDACTTSCAAGPIDTEPVQVVLSGGGFSCGREFFTRLELTWPARVPAGWNRTTVWRSAVPTC